MVPPSLHTKINPSAPRDHPLFYLWGIKKNKKSHDFHKKIVFGEVSLCGFVYLKKKILKTVFFCGLAAKRGGGEGWGIY